MLATTLNVEFDPDLSFDEKKEVYRISNKIVRTMNITQSAVGDKRWLWTTVLGAANQDGGAEHRGPQPAFVAHSSLCNVHGADDFIRDAVKLFFLAAAQIRI